MKSQERIALNKQNELFINELKSIAMLVIAVIIVSKLVFFNEGFLVLARTVISFFYIIILPGYFLMLYWKEHLDLKERLIIAVPVGAATVGLLSYYLGIVGIHVKYHFIIAPLIVSLVSLVIVYKVSKCSEDCQKDL